MKLDARPLIAARLHYSLPMLNDPELAEEVGAVLSRPCFACLTHLRGRRTGRSTTHVRVSALQIAEQLLHPANDACTLHSEPRVPARAIAVIENGVGKDGCRVLTTRLMAYLVVPLAARELEAVVKAICDLARLLRAAAGFVALDTGFQRTEQIALGSMRSARGRDSLSPQRYLERMFREHYKDRSATELAGVEWGTFLGPGHLARIDLSAVLRSSAFARVMRLSPGLAYLQLTPDPLDDLSDGIEPKLVAARQALAPLLMPLTAYSLE